MLQSASLNHSDSGVTLNRHVSQHVPSSADTLNLFFIFCLCDLAFQLDQLVIDSAMEKREMEHKHATIQQRVSSRVVVFYINQIRNVENYYKSMQQICRS